MGYEFWDWLFGEVEGVAQELTTPIDFGAQECIRTYSVIDEFDAAT